MKAWSRIICCRWHLAPLLLFLTILNCTAGSGGRVVAWGSGVYGMTNVPPSATNIIAITAGGAFEIALRNDGTVMVWGGGAALTNVPSSVTNVIAISCGRSHCLALRDDGSIVAWGSVSGGNYGQTNTPANLGKCIALGTSTGNTSLAILEGGRVAVWGDASYSTTNVPAGLSNVVAVCGADNSILALKKDGTLVGWGQMTPSLISTQSNVVAISGSAYTGTALRADGTIVSWNGTAFNSPPPSQAAGAVAMSGKMVLKPDGHIFSWDTSSYGIGKVPAEATNAIAIGVGITHASALLADGAPAILRQPFDWEVDDGVNLTLRVAAVGPDLQLQWKWNGSEIPGATNSTLEFTNIAAAQSGDYEVVVQNSFGTEQSRAAHVKVNATAPVIATNPVGGLVIPGTNIVLSGSAAGPQPISYQWLLNGSPIADATNSTLALTKIQLENEGNYQLAASNRFGVTLSSNAFVNVVGIDDAINAPELTWTTNGNIGWVVQTNRTHDKFAAISCGPLTYRQSQGVLQTTVVGPGKLSFWWITTNGGMLTPLVFCLDEKKIATAASYWQRPLVYVPEGMHQLTWMAITGGFIDRQLKPVVYLDEVTFTPGLVPVSITTQPGGRSVPAGSDVALSVVADGSPTLAYQWRYNDVEIPGAMSTSLTLTNVQVSKAGSYTVVVANGVGSVVSSNAVVSVMPSAPYFVTTPTNQTVSVGSKVSLSPKVRGTEPIFYQWLFNEAPIEGATNCALIITNAPVAASGIYSLLASNALGTAGSSNINLTVEVVVAVAPVIVTQPSSASVSAGQQVIFSVVASSTLPLRYQWQLNGHDISGATNGSFRVLQAQDADAGDYRVLVGNELGTAISSNSTLVVNTAAPMIWGGPGDAVALPGGVAKFSTTGIGTEPSIRQWFKNGQAVPGETNASMTISNAQVSDAGGYSVVISNVAGVTTSRVARLEVARKYAIDFWSPYNSAVPLPEDVVAISGGDYFHSLAVGTNGDVTEWTNNGYTDGALHVPTNVTGIIEISSGANYSLALKKDGTLMGWLSAGAGIMALPYGLSNVTAISSCDSHDLALREDGSLKTWGWVPYAAYSVPLPTNSGPFVAIAAGEFNDAAITEEGSVVFWGRDGEHVYLPDSPMEAAVGVATGKAGNWILTIDGVASLFDQAGNWQMSVSNIVQVGTGSSAYAPEDYVVLLSKDGMMTQIGDAWMVPHLEESPENVVSIFATSSHFMALVNDGTPFIARQPLSRTATSGATVLLSAGVMGVRPMAMQWQRDGVDIEGATNSILVLERVSASDAGSYRCVARNGLGEAVSEAARLTVRGPVFERSPRFVNGRLLLNAHGFTKHGKVVLSQSKNLIDWSSIQTNNPASGTIEFDLPTGSESTLFYRVLEQ